MADARESAMPQHEGRAVELEMRTSATPEQIWNALADPGKISQWFADNAEGWARRGAEVTWIFDEFGDRLPYRVIESSRVNTWCSVVSCRPNSLHAGHSGDRLAVAVCR